MIGGCAYCPAPATTWDHAIPRSRGGGNGRNKVPACWICNHLKADRTPEEFAEFRKTEAYKLRRERWEKRGVLSPVFTSSGQPDEQANRRRRRRKREPQWTPEKIREQQWLYWWAP